MAPTLGPAARDLFPDGAFVRLQNRAQLTYLAADEDGVGVCLLPHGRTFSLSAVWRVQHVAIHGETFVLLQGAAYGRYLAVELAAEPDGKAASGYLGRRAVQRDYDGNNVANFIWSPFRVRMVVDERYILLRQTHGFDGNLRANGRFRFWNTAVSADESSEGRWSTMMQWTVSRFELAPELPEIPLPSENLGAPSGLFRRRNPEADESRTIRYVWANDEGDFDQNSANWATFDFYGRSVFNLMTQVGLRQPDGEVGHGLTLAVRPGLQGRLTPLVTDLPRSVEPMEIVVFNPESQGAQNFVCPYIPK